MRKEYYNSYSGLIIRCNKAKSFFFSIICVQIVFICNSWTVSFFPKQSKWLFAWKIPVHWKHCSVLWSYWSEIVIIDFLHVFHLFYQFTYSSFVLPNRKLCSCCKKLCLWYCAFLSRFTHKKNTCSKKKSIHCTISRSSGQSDLAMTFQKVINLAL